MNLITELMFCSTGSRICFVVYKFFDHHSFFIAYTIEKQKDLITELTLSCSGIGTGFVPVFVKPVRMFREAAWRHETRSADLARVEDAGLKISWLVLFEKLLQL